MSQTLIMGIINATPDSFSDGGRYLQPKDAISHAYRLIEEGVDILDIGAESTRPGHEPVSAEEEWRRLKPILRELCGTTHVQISVDTTKATVAKRALDLGVHIINDIWGGIADNSMLPLIAESDCLYVWMHNRCEPASHSGFATLIAETVKGVNRCLEAGISRDKLWIDPGIGFGKTHEQNLEVLANLDDYCRLGYPVLLGSSRKRVVGNTLQLPVSERLEGSLAIASLGTWMGVHCVRVHDVLETVRACRMVEAIRDSR